MIDWRDLDEFVVRTMSLANPTETDLRRAISALYYCLFHRLSSEGAAQFRGGPALQRQVARAYNHGAMRKVCERYGRSIQTPFPSSLDALNVPAPDMQLKDVAETFVELQEARHAADYDLGANFAAPEVGALWVRSRQAHKSWGFVKGQPATVTFLAALLLDDRWKGRS